MKSFVVFVLSLVSSVAIAQNQKTSEAMFDAIDQTGAICSYEQHVTTRAVRTAQDHPSAINEILALEAAQNSLVCVKKADAIVAKNCDEMLDGLDRIDALCSYEEHALDTALKMYEASASPSLLKLIKAANKASLDCFVQADKACASVK